MELPQNVKYALRDSIALILLIKEKLIKKYAATIKGKVAQYRANKTYLLKKKSQG